MRVVVGVGGGIAAYKVASLVRLFKEAGHSVHVIPTDAALKFIGAATWEALSGETVSTSVFEGVEQVNHVRLGHEADLVVVAPATANLLAQAAHGLAHDLLTNTLLMAHGPVLFAPAMHSEMWAHPATSANVQTLRSRGVQVLEPAVGRLTGSDSGPGRLPEPEEIFDAAMALVSNGVEQVGGEQVISASGPLNGQRVVVTAGGTLEPLDPVRYLGNRSSGKQGVALAQAALDAGAEVALIAANVEVDLETFAQRPGSTLRRIETAAELQDAVQGAAKTADVVIMAAAVADFRPDHQESAKIKKRSESEDPVITLVRNPDILLGLVQERDSLERDQLIVGFAAETGDQQGSVLDYARAKLERKGCDLLVVNEVGKGVVFGQDLTHVTILSSVSEDVQIQEGSKAEVASAVVIRISEELAQRRSGIQTSL